jgi:glycosyltransferase involved in cell wall biosynthesis
LGNNRFRVDSDLDNAEKLALLSFIAGEFGLRQPLFLTGKNSTVAAQFMQQQLFGQNATADLIYWDMASLSSVGTLSAAMYLEILSRKGIVCIEGAGGAAALSRIFKGELEPILGTPEFSVFARTDGERSIRSMRYQADLFRRKYFVEAERSRRKSETGRLPLVAVIVLTYRHEKYIAECLNSVLMQKGRFRMRIIIIDDASTDLTVHVASAVIADQSNDRTEIDFRVNLNNVGVVKNLSAAIRLAAGCDYLAFCEGDDFWSSNTRIQEHFDFLIAHPECVMSFNTIELCSADGSSRKLFSEHINNPLDVIDGSALAAGNLIGNFTACFYDGSLVEIIPEQMFDLYAVDWLFNLYCAQFGGLGHVKKPLSVYRQHEGGEWSGRKELDKIVELWKLMEQYNVFLDYQYDEGFQKYKQLLLGYWNGNYANEVENFDLLIFDDVFPSSRSGFRLAEFTTYLKEFSKSMILTSGLTLHVLEDKPINDVIQKFQRKNPELGNRVMTTREAFPVRLAKLLYVDFLNNAYALLPTAEATRVPFAFTLYPSGDFNLNDLECTHKLKRIFDSPCFRKVIVTQKVTYDYLVHRNLCPIDKVEMIFGVVMPQEAFANHITENKPRWGFGKPRLDICFMAHRYTPHGEDKGYDVFVNVAGILRRRHDNIYFHVVGPYDSRVIDVSSFRDRIKFYGPLDPEQFNAFFRYMDIILSPNISGKIFPGSFDGFPTASCIEAGLRGTAIFAVDEFKSGAGHFTDGKDIVLINYDLAHIVSKVEEYYRDPTELKAVGQRGRCQILDLYSYQSQMLPRLKILHDLLATPFVFHSEKLRGLDRLDVNNAQDTLNISSRSKPSRAWNLLRKYSPEPLKRFYRSHIKKYCR